jgi:hypothetical protein
MLSSLFPNRDPRADASTSSFDALRALLARRVRSASYDRGGVDVARLFKKMDRDRRGLLSLDDFRHALPRFNLVDKVPRERVVKKLYRVVRECAPDSNASGLTVAQLTAFAQERPLRETGRKLWKVRGEELVAETAEMEARSVAATTAETVRARHAARKRCTHTVAGGTFGRTLLEKSEAFSKSLRQEDLRVKGSADYTPSKSRRAGVAAGAYEVDSPHVTMENPHVAEFVFGEGAAVVERERQREEAAAVAKPPRGVAHHDASSERSSPAPSGVEAGRRARSSAREQPCTVGGAVDAIVRDLDGVARSQSEIIRVLRVHKRGSSPQQTPRAASVRRGTRRDGRSSSGMRQPDFGGAASAPQGGRARQVARRRARALRTESHGAGPAASPAQLHAGAEEGFRNRREIRLISRPAVYSPVVDFSIFKSGGGGARNGARSASPRRRRPVSPGGGGAGHPRMHRAWRKKGTGVVARTGREEKGLWLGQSTESARQMAERYDREAAFYGENAAPQ